ncbi:hypothetical protein ABIQ69_11310 [Agromyces sp. G08B096]|uniref:Uncharacterized protein n=1 Tax=Agromyces sp. G08B096 TaxID=3156399 RepID=A0AAU7W5C8_9MICO
MAETVTARFERGTRVVVHQFIRRNDDTDTDSLDGWVVFHSEAVIVIANTPDWADLDPEDYYTATFPLDEVIVSPFTPERAETGSTNVAATLLLVAAALVFWGVLGRAPILIAAGVLLAGPVLVVLLVQGATRKDFTS